MKALFCCLSLFCSVSIALPCANISGTKYGGGSGSYHGGWRQLQMMLKKDVHAEGVEMESTLRGSTNFNDRSDYSVALMYLGRSSEAVELLKKLEAERPGEYFVAANLGTAYELSGNNAEAVRWIKEGIKRNPDSHEGTEWLHAKILEAKIAREKDPDYFEKHSVLNLQPAAVRDGIVVDGERIPITDLAIAIQYQLTERLKFVKPPEPAVASLLFDYAAIEANITSMQSAKRLLELATQYGYPKTKVDALKADFDKRLKWFTIRNYSVVGTLGIGFLALIYGYKRRFCECTVGESVSSVIRVTIGIAVLLVLALMLLR